MSKQLTDAEMMLFCLGASIYGSNTEGSRIIANALDEMQRLKKAAKKSKKRRRKGG